MGKSAHLKTHAGTPQRAFTSQTQQPKPFRGKPKLTQLFPFQTKMDLPRECWGFFRDFSRTTNHPNLQPPPHHPPTTPSTRRSWFHALRAKWPPVPGELTSTAAMAASGRRQALPPSHRRQVKASELPSQPQPSPLSLTHPGFQKKNRLGHPLKLLGEF